jgi:DNA invertase Pin-like site-specific DNA recombinase
MRVTDKKLKLPQRVNAERVAALASNKPPELTGRLVGYARVSTKEQILDHQLDQLRKVGVTEDCLWFEKKSGAKVKRPRLELALTQCVRGDTLVVCTLDRLGRSLKELILIMEGLDSHGVGFRSLNEGIDTTTSMGRLIFNILGAVAQFAREQTIEKTRRSVASTRQRGVQIGAVRKLSKTDVDKGVTLLKGKVPAPEVARQLGVVRQTLLNYPRLRKLVPRRKRKPKD